MKRFLIVFAKEPEKGRVKTRLGKCFPNAQLLNLYKAFLKDTLDTAEKVDCEEKILAYSASGEPRYLKSISRNFKFYAQRGRNLGKRMHNAFMYTKDKGAKKAVIIGSDSPDLSAGIINNAFQRLDKYDFVLGPSYDGGYYLIGLKKPEPCIFEGIRWSTPDVFEDTVKKARKMNKKIFVLKKWYDIDNLKSLGRLVCELKRNRRKDTAKWTKRFLYGL